MTEPLQPSGAVELAVLERSGMIESRHLGAAAVVMADGTVLSQHGDIDALVYPRSTLKFVQAVAVLRSGLDLEGEQLVLAAASHIATPRHVAVVEGMLARAGLTAEALQCPAEWPLDGPSRRAASAPARITMNCSGKHAAFLLACVTNGWPTESYLAAEHPLQMLIRATVEEYTGAPVEHSGVDGCGAPVHAVTLRGLATAVAKISGATTQSDPFAARITAAIRGDAWALDSVEVSRLITELGLIAKNGAEGVFVAGTPNGTAVALKMLDGSSRASIPVGLSLLGNQLLGSQLDPAAVGQIVRETTESVLGAGKPVGEIRSVV